MVYIYLKGQTPTFGASSWSTATELGRQARKCDVVLVMRALSSTLEYQLNMFLAPVLVNDTSLVGGTGVEVMPVVFDEGVEIICIVLPLLCVLQVLTRRLWHGCTDSTAHSAAEGHRPWSGELNDAPKRAYTEEQRQKDRREENMIKGRARRPSLSHV